MCLKYRRRAYENNFGSARYQFIRIPKNIKSQFISHSSPDRLLVNDINRIVKHNLYNILFTINTLKTMEKK